MASFSFGNLLSPKRTAAKYRRGDWVEYYDAQGNMTDGVIQKEPPENLDPEMGIAMYTVSNNYRGGEEGVLESDIVDLVRVGKRHAQYMTEGELRLSLGDRIQYEGPNGMATGTFVDRYTQEQDPLHGGGGPMLVVEEDGGPEVTIAPQDVVAKIGRRKQATINPHSDLALNVKGYLEQGVLRQASRTAGEVYTVGDLSLDIDSQPLSEGDRVNWDGIVGTIANFPMYGLAAINFPVGVLRQVGVTQEPPIRVPTDELKKMSCRKAQWTIELGDRVVWSETGQEGVIITEEKDMVQLKFDNGETDWAFLMDVRKVAKKAQWNDLHEVQMQRKAQATEEEQAFAEQIAQQIADFAGDEKDVGQLIQLIKGKTFADEAKDGAMPGVSLPTQAGPMASRMGVVELEVRQAAQAGLKPQEIALILNVPIEIVAEYMDKHAQGDEFTEYMQKQVMPRLERTLGPASERPTIPEAAGQATELIREMMQPPAPEGESGY